MDYNTESVSTGLTGFGRAVWDQALQSHHEDCDHANRELAKSARLPDVTIATLNQHISVLERNIYVLNEAKKELERDVNMQILDLQRQVDEARARNQNISSHKEEVVPSHSKPNLSPVPKPDLFPLSSILPAPQKTTEKAKGETTSKLDFDLDLLNTPSFLRRTKT